MTLGRNEPCHCGSERKYKNCHLSIDQVSADQKYVAGQRVYSRNWRVTAEAHHKAGRYLWMAKLLEPFKPKRIFDVGCGSGHGVLALFEVFGSGIHTVAVDENGACLDAARTTLSNAGVSVEVIKRLSTKLTPDGYVNEANPIEKPFEGQCTLVQADICNDPLFIDALLAGEGFDAITIWLTGTHMMRQFNAELKQKGISDDARHRLYVQNAVYELADKLLKSGGVLQVVDRTEAPTTDLKREGFLNTHRDQASVTSLEVRELEYLNYEEPNNRRTPMKLTPGSSGRVPTQLPLAITSIISKKP